MLLYYLTTLALFSSSLHVCYSVPTSGFFPFGQSSGDSAASRDDDGSEGPIAMSVRFQYFGHSYDELYLNNNGGISFQSRVATYTPDDFPLTSSPPLIVPFWSDVDNEKGGQIWFRQTTSRSILNQATREIQCFSFAHRSFHADWVFIATWEDVPFYGASSTGLRKRNTFQVVLAYDSTKSLSFVILNYARLEWAAGTASNGDADTGLGGTQAMAGFDAGDNQNFFAIPGSKTPNALQLTHTSNVRVPGKWIFRIESDTIMLGEKLLT